jgi:dTDP-4-dehydrorhamnose reductase
MARILVLGADGMIGHVVRIYLAEQGHNVHSIARNVSKSWDRLDVEELPKLYNYIATRKFETIVNCVGILIKESEVNPVRAIRLNALLPQYLCSISNELGFRIIHASTDCVFSGQNGPYSEDSTRDANGVYGRTKALGEFSNDRGLTIRTSNIGPELYVEGTGLFNWLMQQKGTIRGFGKALWGGVTTLEFAKSVHWVAGNQYTGLVHLTNGEAISKYDLLRLISDIWRKTDVTIERDDTQVSNRSLVCTRKEFVYKVPPYRNMLEELHTFMQLHSEQYHLYA